MMRPGNTGRMIPKPMESTSTAIKTKTKAPLPVRVMLIDAILRAGKPYPQIKQGNSHQNDDERHSSAVRIGPERVRDHSDGCHEEKNWHDRVTPHTIRSRHLRPLAPENEYSRH